MGKLYLVATPIGNLEDISIRAIKVLQSASLIAAEDTRQTKKLLTRYDIKTPLISYHEHNKLARINEILASLSAGDVALVSDAGTPGLNDPGYELVRAVLAADYEVSAVPGPSAPVMALVISGLPTDAFVYLGYLPKRSSDRRRRLEEISEIPYTLIFLEAPHRLKDTLAELAEGFPTRQIAVARELTKLHEEVFRGTVHQALEYFTSNEPRGEFTLVLSGRPGGAGKPWSEEQVLRALADRRVNDAPLSQLAGDIAEQSGWQRRDVYKIAGELRKKNLKKG